MTVAEVVVGDLSLAFTDSTTTPPFSIAIDPLDLTLRGLSSEPGAEFALDADVTIEKTGRLAVEGAVGALPPHACVKAELSGMPLPIFQPYVTPLANLEITGGTLDASGTVEISEIKPGTPPVIRFEGAAGSKDFVTRDTKRNETLVSWRSLDVGGISFAPEKIRISGILSAGAYAKIIIYPDRTTNLAAVFAPSVPQDTTGADSAASAPAPKKTPHPIPIAIDLVRVADCTADFSDLSLILPFSAAIHSLSGDVRELSSVDTARAGVSMEGSVKPSRRRSPSSGKRSPKGRSSVSTSAVAGTPRRIRKRSGNRNSPRS
jgi:hypothetical protein